MTENDISYVIRGAGKGWNKADCKQFIGFCIVSTIQPIIQSTNTLLGDGDGDSIGFGDGDGDCFGRLTNTLFAIANANANAAMLWRWPM